MWWEIFYIRKKGIRGLGRKLKAVEEKKIQFLQNLKETNGNVIIFISESYVKDVYLHYLLLKMSTVSTALIFSVRLLHSLRPKMLKAASQL